MNKIFNVVLAAFLLIMPSTALAIEPSDLEVTGVVVSHTKRYKSSAIVNDRIWWEGETLRLRQDDDSWVTLTLVKVEMVEGKGGVLTFKVGEADSEGETFQVGIKKSTRWGLTR